MDFKDDIPIYVQIEQYLYREIIQGNLQAGQKLPSVRQLAVKLTVNVNTVQRALQEMNSHGILYTKRGEGNFVTEDETLLAQMRKQTMDEELAQFVENMRKYGLERDKLVQALTEYLEEHDND